MPVHIDPADCIAFTKIHGEFVTSHWADVGIVPYIDPLGTIEFALDFRKNGFYRRDDVGIVPYRISANLYCFTNFDRKADSPRPSTLFSFL